MDDLLAGIDVTLTDDILDQIDEIVPPGTLVGPPDQSAYQPPALLHRGMQRADERSVQCDRALTLQAGEASDASRTMSKAAERGRGI